MQYHINYVAGFVPIPNAFGIGGELHPGKIC